MADTHVQRGPPGKAKIHNTSLPISSTRNFSVPQAPFTQLHGKDDSGSRSTESVRADEEIMWKEFVLKEDSEEMVFENTYRVGPDPLKKFSSGRLTLFLFIFTTVC